MTPSYYNCKTPNLLSFINIFLLTIFMIRPNEVSFKAKAKAGIEAPTAGQVVSVSYAKYSATLGPVNPKIDRIREDVEWDEVVRSLSLQKTTPEKQIGTFHPFLLQLYFIP
jgi:hypothetical protein